MKIAIMVEGKTERAFKAQLRTFLEARLTGPMPRLDFQPYDGRLPKEVRLKREVHLLLTSGREPADAVIALTDVYTGTNPPDFADAADAREKMRKWVGPEGRFHPHAAQHDFEAWLLPYWDEIQRLAGSNHKAHWSSPEQVNHGNPPSRRIIEAFRTGKTGRAYSKTRDAAKILRDKDLLVSARACPELKAFLNTILVLCGAKEIG